MLRPPGPYTLQIPYIWNELSHLLEINCDVLGAVTPGVGPSDIVLRNKGGGGVPLDDGANAFWGAARGIFDISTLASTYTLWKRNENNTDRVFISGGTLAQLNGAGGGGTPTPASQLVLTWRSAGGNVLKLVFLENQFPGNARTPLASVTTTQIVAINAYVLGASSIVMARDRSFAVAPMNSSSSQNEKLFNRRFRS